jgi:hypothetical protein
MKTRETSSARRVLIVLGMAAVMLATGFALRWWPQHTLGKQWQQQLATVPDERALEHCERIATLGDQGTRILVGALGSPRQQIARSAQVVLSQQVEIWSAPALGVDRRSQRVAVLIEALAEHVDRFGPRARHFAADLALRVTAWRTSKSIDRLGLITQSEQIVRAASQQPTLGGSDAPRPIERIADRRGALGSDGGGLIRIDELTDLPGGRIPGDSGPLPGAPLPGGSNSRLDEPGQPLLLDTFPPVNPPPRQPVELRVDPSNMRRLAPRVDPPDVTPRFDPSDAQPITAVVARSITSADLRDMLWLDVFRRLHSDSASVVSAAKNELVERGFRADELQIGRQLTDPDVSIRLALAHRLPALRGVDASGWLVELTRDDNAGVRMAAFSTLATSRSRQLRDHVLSLGSQDADPRIRRLAEQLGRGLKR